MRYHHLILVLAALVLHGCGMTNNLKQGVKEDFEFKAGGQEGLVVFSTRFSPAGCAGDVPGSAAMVGVYTEESLKPMDTIFLKTPLLTADFENPVGYVFVRKLRSGRYSFDHFGYAWGYLPGQGGDSEKWLGLSFIVTPGKVYYLGEISIAMTSCIDFDFKVSDQKQRDLRVFASRMHKIPASSVRSQILTPVNRAR